MGAKIIKYYLLSGGVEVEPPPLQRKWVEPLSEPRDNFEGSDNKLLSQAVAFLLDQTSNADGDAYQYVESYNLVVVGYANNTEQIVRFLSERLYHF